jgi:hypothetical protein
MWTVFPSRGDIMRLSAALAFKSVVDDHRCASDHDVAQLVSALAASAGTVAAGGVSLDGDCPRAHRRYLESLARVATSAEATSVALACGRCDDAFQSALTGLEMSADIFVVAFEEASAALGDYDFESAEACTAWVAIAERMMDGFQLLLQHAAGRVTYVARAAAFAALAILHAHRPMFDTRLTFLMRYILSLEVPEPEETTSPIEAGQGVV